MSAAAFWGGGVLVATRVLGLGQNKNLPFSSLQARGHFVLTPLDLDEIN